jgi:predicted CopG family antitoxin
MVKINKSITIEEDIARKSEAQAKEESRSFSSLVEFLLKKYLMALKKPNSIGKK